MEDAFRGGIRNAALRHIRVRTPPVTPARQDPDAAVPASVAGPSAAIIEIDGVSKRFPGRPGEEVAVLDAIDLRIGDNAFVSIVGRSGCGKTTLLNILAGLETPSAGEVRIAGTPVRGPGQGQGVVFQQHALFPWLTAAGNVAFGCRDPALTKADRAARAAELLKLVGLEDAAAKYPREMSGGMQQRVAIARALALDPRILLMDEPFGALDELTRIEMQEELLRIWEARRKTVVFVTHSISEALILSDRIIVLAANPGRVTLDLEVDLARPRVRSDPALLAQYERIWAEISA